MANKYEIFVHYGPYDKETIEALYKVRIYGMPLSFFLLDARKTDTYCHYCASLLTFAIPDSKRVEGRQVVLDGCEHSWVEIDDYVYDTSKVTMWKKDAYYEHRGVFSTKVISDELVHKNADSDLNNPGFYEGHVAWIRELEENLDNNPYRTFLRDHISRFKEEIGYGTREADEERVSDVRTSLEKLYGEIDKFKKENPVYYKRND